MRQGRNRSGENTSREWKQGYAEDTQIIEWLSVMGLSVEEIVEYFESIDATSSSGQPYTAALVRTILKSILLGTKHKDVASLRARADELQLYVQKLEAAREAAKREEEKPT